MKEKFTAGPWFVTPTGYRVMWAEFDNKGAIEHSGVICDTANNKASRTPQNAANARLIASAPDLYAALEQVQIDIKRAATNNVIWPDTQRQIEAALLKARGTEKES